jgi:hypothetical protein
MSSSSIKRFKNAREMSSHVDRLTYPENEPKAVTHIWSRKKYERASRVRRISSKAFKKLLGVKYGEMLNKSGNFNTNPQNNR